jgi:hypothetical protein
MSMLVRDRLNTLFRQSSWWTKETAQRFLSLLSTNEDDVHQVLKDLEAGREITAARPVLTATLRGFVDSSPVVAEVRVLLNEMRLIMPNETLHKAQLVGVAAGLRLAMAGVPNLEEPGHQ